MSFDPAKLAFVRQSLRRGAEAQASQAAPSALVLDGNAAELPDDDVLARLEPWGQGFPVPLGLIEGELAAAPQGFGEGHWKLRVKGFPDPLTWFFGEERGPRLEAGQRRAFAATPQGSARWGRSWLVEALVEAP